MSENLSYMRCFFSELTSSIRHQIIYLYGEGLEIAEYMQIPLFLHGAEVTQGFRDAVVVEAVVVFETFMQFVVLLCVPSGHIQLNMESFITAPYLF